MNIVHVTHVADEPDVPQACSRCGRVIVPSPRAPFPPGHAVTFEIDLTTTPPKIVRVVDSVERMANVPWCDESPSQWLAAFALAEQ